MLAALLTVATTSASSAMAAPSTNQAAAAGASNAVTSSTPSSNSGTGKGAKGAGDKQEDDNEFPAPVDEPAVHKTYSKSEIQRICAEVEGQLIAYYDDIYRVEGCRRRPLRDNKKVYSLQREGKQVRDVSGDVVAALPQGEPLDEAMTIKNARSCRQLEGQYVTFSNVDVYFVEHCEKRLLPDWMTYIKHRDQRHDKNNKGEILSLSMIEFERLPSGKPIPSIVDNMFAKLLSGEAGVEVIPVDEACARLEGRVASYYSYVYRIEKCRKREIAQPEIYLKKVGIDKIKIIEMTSEQWLSLPSGAPIVSKQALDSKESTEFKPKWRQPSPR
jgi:hypothetical protein